MSENFLEKTSKRFRTMGPVAEFFEAMEPVKKAAETVVLPERIPVIVKTTTDSKELFGWALSSWVANFDPASIQAAAARLGKIISDEERYLLVKYLGEVRRVGVLAGGTWTNLGAMHSTAPKAHRDFMSALGVARDVVRFKEAVLVPDALEKLKQACAAYPDPTQVFAGFRPAGKRSFDNCFAKSLALLQTTLDKPSVMAKELHEARKDGSRQLINMHMLAALHTGDDGSRRVYLWLWRIDNDLGKLNDRVVKGEISENEVVEVKPEWKQLLQEYIERVSGV